METLTQRELARPQVPNNLLAEPITTKKATTLMGVRTRHARRILAASREEGESALAHGNRGRRPSNATPDNVVAEAIHLALIRYSGANHTHLSELLSGSKVIDICRIIMRRILVYAALFSSRCRRPPKHRIRRQRMSQKGMLV